MRALALEFRCFCRRVTCIAAGGGSSKTLEAALGAHASTTRGPTRILTLYECGNPVLLPRTAFLSWCRIPSVTVLKLWHVTKGMCKQKMHFVPRITWNFGHNVGFSLLKRLFFHNVPLCGDKGSILLGVHPPPSSPDGISRPGPVC